VNVYKVVTKSGLTIRLRAESKLAASYRCMCEGYKVDRVEVDK